LIIISDCLAAQLDEGCLKVVNNLAVRLKAADPETMIISYDRKPVFSDTHLPLNKLFINKQLFSFIKKSGGAVLYIPFASNTTASCLRTFILSVFSRKKINVIFVLRFKMNLIARIMLKMSQANVIALSRESFRFYESLVGKHAFYLKTGIDTEKFTPAGPVQKNALKNKYGVPENMKVVVHVGHLKTGRNIEKLQDIDKKYFVLLVVSSVTEKNEALRTRLENRPHTRIIDSYVDNIQEVYQLSDVYIFPVAAPENCIDVPLSVLEAAACNIPVVTTPYGELTELIHSAGFYQLKSCSGQEINTLIDKAVKSVHVDTRKAVLEYDWNESVVKLEGIVNP
jgi:glycosyltransferase involved in cell wall biosynthesis